jgi:hypothetical protein
MDGPVPFGGLKDIHQVLLVRDLESGGRVCTYKYCTILRTMNANSYNLDRSIGGVGMMDDQDGNGMGAQDTKI